MLVKDAHPATARSVWRSAVAARCARVHRRWGLALAVAILAGPAARDGWSQTAAAGQVIRAAVHTVPIYATVTDARGALVSDLTITDFEVDDNGKRQPITVFTNDVQPIAIAILLDVSPSLFRLADRVRDAATAFTRHLLSSDRACLGTFNQVVSLNPTLTADPDALVRHIGDDVPFPSGTAVWDAIDAGRRALASEGGRRVILIVTDAEDNCSRADSAVVRDRVAQDGAMVYAVGVRGREGLDAGELEALARATGGWYFELKPDADLDSAMGRIAEEVHRQYVLGFTAAVLDDRIHRIEVKVSKAGLTVRARRSYVASTSAEVR
jgi:Ca-activated chloride channel homolog